MKKTFLLAVSLLTMSLSASAIPAIHKLFPVKQKDGSTVMLYKVGDRNFNYYTTPENYIVVRNAEGTLCYAQLQNSELVATDVVCHDADQRTAEEQSFLASNTLKPSDAAFVNLLSGKRQTAGPKKLAGASTSDGLGKYGTSAGGAVPTVGDITIPVIMVQYADTKFQETTTIEKLTRFFNEEGYKEDSSYERGSVRDYFKAQSRGMFVPTFDVVAMVTLDNGYAYYGQNSGTYTDVKAIQMVKEAVEKAVAQGVDFSKYVSSKTGDVPNVTIYYAGLSEATGGDDDTIWPHEYDLTSFLKNMSGTQFGSYFVGNELYGTSTSNMFMGMGVFCHEFSHAMGLPDFYDPTYSYKNDSPMGMWSVMDTGAYANNTYAPVGYNAYERSYMGWLDLHELTSEESVTLTDPNLSEGQMAAFFRNPSNTNEYFILENRQPGTWYNSDNGSGLLVTRFCYDKTAWTRNTANTTQSAKRAYVVTANGRAIADGPVSQDHLFGNGVNNKETHALYNGSTLQDYGVYKILKQPDGSITFNFRNKSLAMDAVDCTTEYEQVTDVSQLAAEDVIIFVNKDEQMAMGVSQQGSHRSASNVKVSGNKVYANDNAMKFTLLQTSSGDYGFWAKDKNTYLSASSTGVKMVSNADNNCVAKIDISNGNAAISFTGKASHKYLGYNADDVQFTCFTSAQSNIQIYRVPNGKSDGIDSVGADGQQKTAQQGVYNLKGQYVGSTLSGLPKGIYVQQGKKVVVK